MAADKASFRQRVLSGMRPTGLLHLGHYFLLKKWAQMQKECDCHFFVADYHALTTGAENYGQLPKNTVDMIVCWLAAGIDPKSSVIFVQSQLREHAELHVILSMVCPLPWLQRVPHYKEVASLSKPEDVNYGFLGYPVLQTADIVVHGADLVPVGEDQEAHVELAARIARSFNDRFGKDEGWEEKARDAAKKLRDKKSFHQLCSDASQKGDAKARRLAIEMVREASGIDRESTQRLLGYVDGGGRQVLIPPEVMRSEVPRLPGLDGKKMSKSDNNDIGMIEKKDSFSAKIKIMPTDPARVRRDDPGNPEKCPVWTYHKIFSNEKECKHVWEGCTTAGIGCLDCKAILIDNIETVVAPLRERAKDYLGDQAAIEAIIKDGNERARESASVIMKEVREASGLPKQ